MRPGSAPSASRTAISRRAARGRVGDDRVDADHRQHQGQHRERAQHEQCEPGIGRRIGHVVAQQPHVVTRAGRRRAAARASLTGPMNDAGLLAAHDDVEARSTTSTRRSSRSAGARELRSPCVCAWRGHADRPPPTRGPLKLDSSASRWPIADRFGQSSRARRSSTITTGRVSSAVVKDLPATSGTRSASRYPANAIAASACRSGPAVFVTNRCTMRHALERHRHADADLLDTWDLPDRAVSC